MSSEYLKQIYTLYQPSRTTTLPYRPISHKLDSLLNISLEDEMKITAVLLSLLAAASAAPQIPNRVCEYSSMEACYNACNKKGTQDAVNSCIDARCGSCPI